MPILDLPPNPPSNSPSAPEPPAAAGSGRTPPARPLSGRYANLDEHELLHLLDAVDDEVARAAFRESVYKSIIICMAVAWFIVYGPKIILHQPEYKDPFAAIKEHDRAISLSLPRDVAPHPPAHTMPDRQIIKQLQQARPTPPAPAAPPPPTPQAQSQPQPQEMARNIPPVEQPALPVPSAPTPRPQQQQSTAVPDAPVPTSRIAHAGPTSSRDAMQDLIRNAHPGSGGINAPSPGSEGPLQSGAQVLSDTQGVDFSSYLRQMLRDVKRNWEPLIPEEVRAPLLKRGVTGIRFMILPDGTISGPNHGQPVLETPSGDVALDKAAWGAIIQEGQFPPLPKEFHGPNLELRIGFYYNTPVR